MGAKTLILMSGRLIIDITNVIAIFSGETSIKEHLLKADEVFISSTVLGELFFVRIFRINPVILCGFHI